MKRPAVLAGIIAVIAIAVFLPSLHGEWLYDDHPLIEENVRVHSFDNWTHWFTSDFWDVGMEASGRILYWRPLVSLTYAIDWQTGGGSPVSFHITNLLLYALVSVLAFATMRRWLGSLVPAFLAALLFVVHPTKAESVAWISGRTDVLCALGLLVAAAGMAIRMRGHLGRGIALEILGTAVAYGCKEQAIVLPIFAVIERWIADDKPALDAAALKRLVIAALPQTATAIVYLVLRSIWLPIGSSSGGIVLTAKTHLLAVFETFGRYFALAFAPHQLSSEQGLMLSRHHALVQSTPYIVLGVVGIVVLLAVAVVLRRRFPVATMGILFFLGALVPTANIKLTSLAALVAERFLFIPILGLVFIAGSLLAKLPARRSAPLAGAICLAFAMMTLSHGTDFVSEREFWARELELHPQSTSALRFTLTTQMQERRYTEALDTLGHVAAMHAEYDWLQNEALQFAFDVALVASALTPDLRQADLRAIDAFCAEVLDHRSAAATLHAGPLRVTVPILATTGDAGIYLAQLLAVRAETHSRLGDDEGALQLSAAARSTCHDCVSFTTLDALTRARAGHVDEALALLDDLSRRSLDPRIVLTRDKVLKAKPATTAAERFAALGLWGRAYAATAFAPTLGYAEIAFRAGDAASAQKALAAGGLDPSSLQTWAEDMGWTPKTKTPPEGGAAN